MLYEEPAPGGLVPVPAVRAGKFHTAHKITLMVHPGNGTRTGSPKHYTEMGRLVADAGKRDWDELTAEYGTLLMEGLSVRSPACTLPQAQVSTAKGWARGPSM